MSKISRILGLKNSNEGNSQKINTLILRNLFDKPEQNDIYIETHKTGFSTKYRR